jgi:hypothetical protein
MNLPDNEQMTNVQKNVIGYAIISLSGAVCTLFFLYINLNNYIKGDLQKNNDNLLKIVEKNNIVLKDLQTVFVTSQDQLRVQRNINWKQRGELAAKDFIESLQAEIEQQESK